MFHRLLTPSRSSSFFIFGARGTGKSTFVKAQWGQKHHYINLLLDQWERRYSRDPDLLIADLSGKKLDWVVIDEVQKVPKLLDIVQELIESRKIRFLLTGSSARKLRRKASNLLAGRAFSYQLFPLTHVEVGAEFDLDSTLSWGTLPKIFSLEIEDRKEFLRSYAQTYLREEILQEQIVRNGSAFRSFLEVAAQQSGKTVNFSKIAKDVGVDTKTSQSYFQILEDTLVGYLIPAFTRSARKSVRLAPKFLFFDLGVKRAIESALDSKVTPRTSHYGECFEQFILLETIRLNSLYRKDFKVFHYQTTAGGEIDLVLQKSNTVIAVEIKSSNRIDVSEVEKTARVASALNPSKTYYISQDPVSSTIAKVRCLHWKKFFSEIFQ